MRANLKAKKNFREPTELNELEGAQMSSDSELEGDRAMVVNSSLELLARGPMVMSI